MLTGFGAALDAGLVGLAATDCLLEGNSLGTSGGPTSSPSQSKLCRGQPEHSNIVGLLALQEEPTKNRIRPLCSKVKVEVTHQVVCSGCGDRGGRVWILQLVIYLDRGRTCENAGNEILFVCLCGNSDGGLVEDVFEVDDLEGFEFLFGHDHGFGRKRRLEPS